jgi:uncharacterized protein
MSPISSGKGAHTTLRGELEADRPEKRAQVAELRSPSPRPWNPLTEVEEACRLSSYAAPIGETLVHPLRPTTPIQPDLLQMHADLREKVLDDSYPCLGARSVFNSSQYRIGIYPELGSCDAALGLCHDLYEFSHQYRSIGNGFVSFLAGFVGPAIDSEPDFEGLLWDQLGLLHEIDRRHFAWDPTVSADPADPQFSFSIGSRAYFVVGMHALASRTARQLQTTTLVFNLHEQFEHLRGRDRFETMKNTIRARDLDYHGSVNPVLENHGTGSEARQYSGRAVPLDWVCPHASFGESA